MNYIIYIFFSLISEALNDYAKGAFCPESCDDENISLLDWLMNGFFLLAGIGFVLFIFFADSIDRHLGLENQAKEVDEIDSIVK